MRQTMIHQRTHPQPVEGCFACRIGTVNLAANATPYRREATVTQIDAWEKQMRDDDAYRTLRKNGLQPARTAGCHELAQVDDKRFIEGLPALWEDRAEYLTDLSDTPQVKIETP